MNPKQPIETSHKPSFHNILAQIHGRSWAWQIKYLADNYTENYFGQCGAIKGTCWAVVNVEPSWYGHTDPMSGPV